MKNLFQVLGLGSLTTACLAGLHNWREPSDQCFTLRFKTSMQSSCIRDSPYLIRPWNIYDRPKYCSHCWNIVLFLHTYTVWTCTYHVQHRCHIHTIRNLTPSKMFVNGWKWDQTTSSYVLMSEKRKYNWVVNVYSHFEIGVIVKDLHCKTGIICDNYLFSSAHFEKVYIFTIAQLIFIPIAFSYI